MLVKKYKIGITYIFKRIRISQKFYRCSEYKCIFRTDAGIYDPGNSMCILCNSINKELYKNNHYCKRYYIPYVDKEESN